MPLYTDPGYSYYSGAGTYSPYYSTPLYGSSSSSPYAPYSSTYNRAYSGTYVLPSTSRSAQYTSSVSRYHPMLSTITESPLTSRSNFMPLTRIQSPKVSTYSPSLASKYISSRPSRPKNINTADIDVSASSRYGRHHHMDDRKKDDERSEAADEVQVGTNTDSDTSSSIVDPNSPYMPRIDGTDAGHHARSTIKRNRAVVRLSIMRPRSRDGSKKNKDSQEVVNKESETIVPPESVDDPLKKFYSQNKTNEEGIKVTVTDTEQSQTAESSLSEVIIEVDPVTHTVRRLSIPQVPSFHDICEDISSDKIDDDLNAGVLRRRASLIQEQEIEILNELQKSQSDSIQVIHLERNISQDDCRKSRKSKKTKKIRHRITANVEIQNPPLTPVIQQTIEEESASTVSPTKPKFTFSIEDIEEHKIFKLPKKRVKSVKSKKVDETSKQEEVKTLKPLLSKDSVESPKQAAGATVKPPALDKDIVEASRKEEPEKKVATPKPINKIQKSESGEDFWSQIDTRESLYMNKRKKIVETLPPAEESACPSEADKLSTPQNNPETVDSDFWSQINTRESLYMDKRKKIVEKIQPPIDESEWPTKADTPSTPQNEPETVDNDFWSQINTRESLYMDKRKKIQPPIDESPWPTKADTSSTPQNDPETVDDFWAQIDARESVDNRKESVEKTQPPIDESPWPSETNPPTSPTTPKKPTTKPLAPEKVPPTVPIPKKTTIKSQDSPKSKNSPKLVAKKKSSPKNDAKEEAAESNSKPKAKPTKNNESIASPKINSGSGAKSPEKKKTVKSDTQSIITKKTSLAETASHSHTEDTECKQIPEISTKTNDQNTPKTELKKPLTPTIAIADTTAKSDATSGESGNVNPTPCDYKTNNKKETKPIRTYATSLSVELSPVASPTSPTSPATPETQSVASPFSSAPKPTTDVSTAQVSAATAAPTTTTTTKNSPTTPTAVSTAPPSPTTKIECDVLGKSSNSSSGGGGGGGGNNLSKFATISNLAQCLLDVDAELEDYIPSSAEETDSSSDSYSVDGSSLSASMKKKNKQLKKKAKEQQQAFDPNKKIKIDTKKKCYVKEEAPRYPLVATPRPLWKREKVTYEESSNSSSEETDSESECTTSDEYEDELCPKDAIIRMSTCSNDSGFDGGTAPSSGKKVLDCDVNCHKKCEKLTANLCGVKQKLIVEALACVKRGAQEARDSPCSPLSLNPAYKIEANDDETSYTYLQFQKSGRITAPATTIPRFKKYSVEDFHFLAVLGKGSFGKVLLAELQNTDFYYAVKCLKKDVVLEDDDVECTLIERKVLALGTKHPYLCHLFCTFQTESHLFFVMEYLNGGDLMFHIQESGRFPEDRARFYGAEIISGLKFLHKKGIIYRDLKLDNVLLDFDGHVRIADFGMCKLQIYLDKTADSFCGTPDYMAPEIIKGDKYNQNVDWWSFGVLLYEMLIGQSPFSGCDEDELFWSICNEIPWFPVYITKEATSILKGLLEKDYTRRVGSQYSPAGDICDHIFFKDIDWGLLEKRQLPPPFKPQVKHPLDTQYFDRAFTRERVRLTPIDKEILQSMDQEQFQGFSYTNPNATLD